MNKNEILLAAKTNQYWRYHDQLLLAKALATAPFTAETTWVEVNTYLRAHLEFFPGYLSHGNNRKISEQYLTILDADYPLELAEIYEPPIILFYRGQRELLKSRKVGIVGARKCTPYSQTCLRKIIPELVNHQLVTVSGLAVGVDMLVHQETLSAKGKTIAVIGNGVDLVYPPQNTPLQQIISQQGLLLSEYLPGDPPRRFHFPQRNRIIAGLSEAVVVTEARRRSGSLITANLALQENRNVFAIPGRILDEESEGTNQLIQAGATPVLTAQDILTDFQAYQV
ncbi:DNA-processing protein DprA [Lapidilactobacillus mulanensis]|uniref:DNA-processing protein DprA n=1 Tax=Lapidilactobacillus mulanensis TaxID=2485999 RepID=A0ABW4DS40_9LACO|nr:DNA-processing protein DprA [Lapidilactobacillus mulanensis]